MLNSWLIAFESNLCAVHFISLSVCQPVSLSAPQLISPSVSASVCQPVSPIMYICTHFFGPKKEDPSPQGHRNSEWIRNLAILLLSFISYLDCDRLNLLAPLNPWNSEAKFYCTREETIARTVQLHRYDGPETTEIPPKTDIKSGSELEICP